MNALDHELRTSTLWKMLFKATSTDVFLDENEQEINLPSFHEYITALCQKRGEVPDRVIKRGDIEKSFGHSLFRGSRRPSRDTVLQLAFGFGADLDLTQRLLRCAEQSPLYPRVPRDVVISFCLMHNMTLLETQEMLAEKKLPLIGGKAKL